MEKYSLGSAAMLRRMKPIQRREELKDRLWRAAELAAFAAFIALFLFAMMGCAGRLAVEKPLYQVRMHETIRGLVQVANMGADCEEQDAFMKRIISDALVTAGAPSPDKLDIRPLSGSSLCGPAQGVADPIGTPDYGAWGRARAEVAAYWSGITYAELQRAHTILMAMRPIPAAAAKVAKKSAK